MPQDAQPNGSAPDLALGSWSRVAEMQAKVHRRAAANPGHRFDDLFNFVCDVASHRGHPEPTSGCGPSTREPGQCHSTMNRATKSVLPRGPRSVAMTSL
jgi:RNA-directed DNA polymerase